MEVVTAVTGTMKRDRHAACGAAWHGDGIGGTHCSRAVCSRAGCTVGADCVERSCEGVADGDGHQVEHVGSAEGGLDGVFLSRAD